MPSLHVTSKTPTKEAQTSTNTTPRTSASVIIAGGPVLGLTVRNHIPALTTGEAPFYDESPEKPIELNRFAVGK
jgi:hypothetical protein